MTQTIDVNFFKPFVEGTLETLKIQCQLEATPAKPFLKGQGPKIDCEIAALLGLTSTKFSGNIAICFTKGVFLGLMNNMLGEQYQEITPEFQDGAGELLNMIFGYAKRVLNAQGHDIQKAIPSIVRGRGIEAIHLSPSPVYVLPFDTKFGAFQIEICAEASSLKG